FDYELQMAQMNRQLGGGETLFVPTSATYSYLSSSLLKEVAALGGDVAGLVPDVVATRPREPLPGRWRPGPGPRPRHPQASAGPTSQRKKTSVDVHEKLDEITSLVEQARAMPMSASCIVNRPELLTLLEELRALLPQEIDLAEQLLAGRER